MNNKVIVILSFLICILVVFSIYKGISDHGFYGKETLNWKTQSIGQDYINLYLIIPSLFSSIIIYSKWRKILLVWAGIIMYLLYTYIIYCFTIHFNNFFLVYCAILGLCFYLILYFFYFSIKEGLTTIVKPYYFKITTLYFLFISVAFYLLWLSEIVPAILYNRIPPIITEAGLFNSPVYILDLAIFLPGVFLTGILLLRNNKVGFLLAPSILTFFILMNSTIGVLALMTSENGAPLTILMGLLVVVSFVLLILNFYFESKIIKSTVA